MAEEPLDEFLSVKPQPAWRRYVRWGVVVLVVLLLALLLAKCFGGSSTPRFSTAKVARGNLTTTVSATGKLAPINQVTVGSQLSGQVIKVLVDVNDRVTAGQPLAEIDPEQIDDQIRQGEAQLAANRAQVEQAKATVAESRAQQARLEEVYRLSNGKVPSATELQTGRADAARAIAALRAAEQNVLASQAALAQNKTQRNRAVITSPVNGVVLARQIDPGQTVAASFNTPTLFVIAQDLSHMKLEVAIDEADVGTVKEGQKASFTVDAFPGRVFPARITRVEIGSNQTVAAASSSSSTATTSGTTGSVVSYAADLSVANANLELRPGMTATADITTSDKPNVLLIPNAALRFNPQAASAGPGSGRGGIAAQLNMGPPRRRSGQAARSVTVARGGGQTVFVRGADGQPKQVLVTTGDSDGFHTEVLSGLNGGEEVITGQMSGAGGNGG